jgi:hypothetical protein
VTVEVATKLSEVSSHFLGVNLDWWLLSCGGEGKNWGRNATAITLDLRNKNLRTLAKGLGGGTLRIGGTHEGTSNISNVYLDCETVHSHPRASQNATKRHETVH